MKLINKNNKIKGFTLIETLIVVVIIGIITGLSIPSWFSFVNRQRMKAVNNDLIQSLLDVQNKARQDSTAYTIEFRYQTTDKKIEQVTYIGNPTEDQSDIPEANWQELETQYPEIKIDDSNNTRYSVTFDYRGRIDDGSIINVGDNIALTFTNSSSTKKCVLIKTLLGAMESVSDDKCN
jgi:prepilin-type N-terminal cleavage/methylation domain-containing protein